MFKVKWRDVEKKLPPYRTKHERQLLRFRMRLTAFIILSLSLIEHILSVVSAVAQVVNCPRIKSIYRAYYLKSFPQVFTLFSYSAFLGSYIKFVHITSTFVWSFTDLFIIMISCGLSLKFKLINERMLEDKGKVLSSLFLDILKCIIFIFQVHATRILERPAKILSSCVRARDEN